MTYADAAYQKGYSRGYASAVERDEALAELDYVPDFAIAPTDYIPEAEWNAMTRDEQDRRCAEIFERERRRLRYGRVKRERDEALALLRELKEGASFFDSAIELFDLNGVEVKERIEALLSRKTDAPVSGV